MLGPEPAWFLSKDETTICSLKQKLTRWIIASLIERCWRGTVSLHRAADWPYTGFWESIEFWHWGTFRGGGGMTPAEEAGFLGETCYLVSTQRHHYWSESIPIVWCSGVFITDRLPYRSEFAEAGCQGLIDWTGVVRVLWFQGYIALSYIDKHV